MKILISAALLLLPPLSTASAQKQKETLHISQVKGELRLLTPAGMQLLRPGEPIPQLRSAAEAAVVSGWVELSCQGTLLRAATGAAFAITEEEAALSVQTKSGSSAVQLTDAIGNVAVITDNSALRVWQNKKQMHYKALSGKVLLTDTDGETSILNTGDEHSTGLGGHTAAQSNQADAAPAAPPADPEEAQLSSAPAATPQQTPADEEADTADAKTAKINHPKEHMK
ncbi:MAG TPA: hypothetical protein PLL10_04560 [Elusimicrobiales bacterium]|nr:hypothetical protein [Elusimicrobiales bacterium]